jgi:signal transduction histidine kinase
MSFVMDFSQILTQKSDTIVDSWVKAVYEDKQIDIAQEMTYKAVRDSLPRVLEAMATMLSQSQDNDVTKLVDASLEHGRIRAEQGFEPAEIAREYRLLRSIIFSVLETDLVQASPADILRAVRLIDTVIDEAIARCFNSYTEGRLQELAQLKSQLELTNQELTRLVRASKENLSHLAHELKTPLTSIIGYSDLYLRQQKQNSDGQSSDIKDNTANLESIERVLRSGRLLLRLINDALEISRYDAGQMKLQPAEVKVQELIHDTLHMVEPLARSKDLKLATDCTQAPETVWTDGLRLQQIVTNLLSNAIRYTESGTVCLRCVVLPNDRWSIQISDTGAGIEPADQLNIFTPYFRADTQSKVDGTGLGLAIVDRLVKLLQGEMMLASHPGSGSTFAVTLPLEVKLTEPVR